MFFVACVFFRQKGENFQRSRAAANDGVGLAAPVPLSLYAGA